jgi:acetyl esterase
VAGPIDPEIAAWLRDFPAPDIDYRDVDAVRALFADYMADEGGPAPRWPRDDVTLTSLSVGSVPALMWRPRDADGPLPVVLAFHGGAFIVGAPLGAERIAVPLAAAHGVCTVSVGYRLAPEHPAPAAFDDAKRALDGLASIPGIDVERVAVYGSSAGAALAAGLALHARDMRRPIALQSLSCPALDSRTPATEDDSHSMQGISPTLSRESADAMWQHYLAGASPTSEAMSYVVPALATDVSGVAPAHITVAECDVLRDEGLDYARRLRLAGVPVDVDVARGAVHGFDGLLPDSALAHASLTKQVDAIVSALKA